MATALLSRDALQQRTGDDGRGQRDGDRAEQAVARGALVLGGKSENEGNPPQKAALGTRGEGRAGDEPARGRRVGETRELKRAGAAAVTEITAAASCIRASAVEGA